MFKSSKKFFKDNVSLPSNLCVKWMLEKESEKFKKLCLMHLSFILDLHGEDFETLTDEFILGGNHKESNLFKAWTKKIIRERSKKGACLESCSKIIQHIEILISFLNQEKNLVEGLFRKTGNLNRQKVLRQHLSSFPFIPNFKPMFQHSSSSSKKAFFLNDPNLSSSSPHDLANLLKSLLRSLCTPVITSNNHMAIFQISELKSEASQLECMQLLFQLLDHTQMNLLTSILQLLHNISSSPQTLMDPAALATIFLPIIFLPKNMRGEELVPRLPWLTQLLALMINKQHLIQQLPPNLLSDVQKYYDKDKSDSRESGGKRSSEGVVGNFTCKKRQKGKRKSDERNEGLWGMLAKKSTTSWSSSDDDATVCTAVTFADQKASLQAGLHTNTSKALGQLYAYIECLPADSKEGSLIRKRRQESHRKVIDASVRSARTEQDFNNKNKIIKNNKKNKVNSSHGSSFDSAAINQVNHKYNKVHNKCSRQSSSPLPHTTNNHNNEKNCAKIYKEKQEKTDIIGCQGERIPGCHRDPSYTPLKRFVSKVHVVDCRNVVLSHGVPIHLSCHGDDIGNVV